jgi:drug/metabolite transporter (DMT)-like permease
MEKKTVFQSIGLGLGAFGVWALGDAATKFSGKASVPFLQIITLSSLSAMIVIAFACWARGRMASLRPQRLKIEIPRALMFVVQSFVNVMCFTYLPLTTVYAALFISPLLISVAGALFLKEPLSRRQGFYIVLGFVGALLAVNPFGALLTAGKGWVWLLLPLYPLLFSTNMFLMRFERATESSESLSFFPLFIRFLVGAPLALATWSPMTAAQTASVLGIGVSTGLGFVLISKALARAPAAIVSPLHYTQIVIGAVLGAVFWGDWPDWHVGVGSAIIIMAGMAGARLAARKEILQETVGAKVKFAES